MQAYEFYATPKNGVISIPDQYKKKLTKTVKVIVLEEISSGISQGVVNSRTRTDLLSPISIDTCGWKFDKDEANER